MTKSSATRARRSDESVAHIAPAAKAPALPRSTQRSDKVAVGEDVHLKVLRPELSRDRKAEVSANPRKDERFPSGESEVREYLETAAVGMHWLAPDGTVLWANRTELALLGYKEGEFVGHSLAEFLGDAAMLPELLHHVSDGASVHGWEFRLRCGDGQLRWFRIDASPHARDGKLVHVHCFLLEIGEKRRADEAQMRLAAIVESSDDAIASKDLNGIITSWNAAAEHILGYTAEEIVGKSILTIIPPELHKDEPEILRRIQAGERIEHFQTIRERKSGERIHVSVTVSPVRDSRGKIIGAAKILRDITEQKKLEAALRTTERLASVGRLAATVAHEINNPLEAVTNLIYLACHDPDVPEGARKCLTIADEELKRVAHIARQTLGFYRDATSPLQLSVATAVGDIVAIYHRRFQYKGIRVEMNIPADLSTCAVQGEFKQIVSNLVSNAIDASPQGARLRVRAWASRHADTGAPGVRLVVADEGSGIPEEIRQKVFTPFFTTKRDVGTGLGLWIVRDLLLRRGGSIRCRSRAEEPNTGTTMMVFLPSEEESVTREDAPRAVAAD